jgi:hypothetical protein
MIVSLLFFLFAATMVLPHQSAAQAVDSDTSVSSEGSASSSFGIGASAGLGIGTLDYAGSAKLYVRSGSSIIAVRGASAFELFGDVLHDIGLLYGYTFQVSAPVAVSVMAGLGMMGGTRRASMLGRVRAIADRPSVLVEMEGVYTPLPFIGLSLTGFGNLNKEESFAGATLTVHVGLLR